MDGRCHLYEGYSAATLMLPIRIMAHFGVKTLILSNASGGLNPQFQSGDIMIIRDHISLMWLRDECQPAEASPFQRGAITPYDPELAEGAMSIAHGRISRAHYGVYAGVPGPDYETRRVSAYCAAWELTRWG